ncbi:MAG: indolepyruvate oxidoreductase subunit beta [Deltaproteobacteria bacterium]|nr:indolepyruvate oxidoreductase subunit beta [Deltaproteobacteria bacterium]MBW2648985.1 indolepyruvate oxidoreductase subunit beta [Deltaproteobacteria bacterium]
MDESVRSVLLVGVGGQGTIMASDILSAVMIGAGFDAKKSEVHGMAQRGGCVSSHVRFGSKVYSPLAGKGDVDVLVSFEKLETLRYLEYLKADGKVIINEEEIYPPSVNLGEAEYPRDAIDFVKEHFKDVKVVNATAMALRSGDKRMANTVILGVLSSWLDIEVGIWEDVLKKSFSPKILEGNINAFRSGRGV